jgi:hypothetical protein
VVATGLRTALVRNAGAGAPASPAIRGGGWRLPQKVSVAFVLLACALPLHSREKDGLQYGMGLIVNLTEPEADIKQAVEEVVQNGLIRGTKEYNKDEYVTGATAPTSTPVFAQWSEGGTVFYKVREHAIDPRNFKDGGDVGTLAVRYVIQNQGANNTVLRIDAVFVEDFRHTVHASDGTVESSEYKDIRDHLDATELMKKQSVEAERERQNQLARKKELGFSSERTGVAASPRDDRGAVENSDSRAATQAAGASTEDADGDGTPQTLEQRVRALHRQLERLIKSPGAALKSAPFHTASTLKSLPPGTDVLILISTPYWYGVETQAGDHGWIPRDELESLP